MHVPFRPRRSALFLPASNQRAIDKARSLPADIVILDLEDAVAPEMKDQARSAVCTAVKDGGFGGRELVIRVNALETPWGADDLAAVKAAGADAVLAPKVATADDVELYHAELAGAPAELGLWVMIETCRAVSQLQAIADRVADTRLAAFVIGTNDLALEMRAQPTPDRAGMLPILTLAVAAARAAGLIVLDGVCNDFSAPDRFAAECAQGRALGFDGKSLIHPVQIDACNAAFGPSHDEIALATMVTEAFEHPDNTNKGAIRVDGRMVERLHLEDARRILALAAAITAR